MNLRRIAVGAAATAALALTIAVPAHASLAAAPSGTLTIYNHQTQADTLDLGASGTTVGDVTTGSGTIALRAGGKAVGTFAYRADTVRVPIPGGNENRISQAVYTLPGGSIMTSGLISIQQGTRPTTAQPVVIVGGTGKYAGANGSAVLKPVRTGLFTVTFSFTN